MILDSIPIERGNPAQRIQNALCTTESAALSFVRGTVPLLQLLLRNENVEPSLRWASLLSWASPRSSSPSSQKAKSRPAQPHNGKEKEMQAPRHGDVGQ